MGVSETEAWITSAVKEEDVNKAMTLAWSLRRVGTTRKVAVLTTAGVDKDLRDKLKEVFDFTIVLAEHHGLSGWDQEDYAKIQGFFLQVFKKCVYLAPNTLVVKNCDDIFEKYSSFAAGYQTQDNSIDTSVYIFTPDTTISDNLLKTEFGCVVNSNHEKNAGGFSKYLLFWMKNNVQEFEKLDDEYNVKIDLKGNSHHGGNANPSIFNFIDVHPLDLDISDLMMWKSAQEIEDVTKFAVDLCLEIFIEHETGSARNSNMTSSVDKYKAEPIAIVGMSFRLPGGNNEDEFWSLLAEGGNAVVPVPSSRWTKEHSYYHCRNRKIEAGFLTVPIDEFDSKFFGLSPKEAEYLDPQQRLLLEVTWEAFEDAMIDPGKLKGTQTGVFVGSWLHEYKDMLSHSEDFDFFRTYMGSSIATASSRLSHFFETMGPSIAVESGCSAAISAVDMACKSLRNGTSSFAIVGGSNLMLFPFEANLMEYVLSPDYRCRTFDAGANGFVRAEGVVVLLMKRLSDAVKDDDSILGLIRGTAIIQEGVSKSFGTPTVKCESLAMELALKDAAIEPKDVSYVEAHGTGTVVGDPMEVAAIKNVYSRERTDTLFIGSVKTNIGHTEAVSGLAGIVKVLLSMKHEVIPRHLNLTTLNPNLNLEDIPAQIPLSPVMWSRKEGKSRIAGVSSFGITGTDGHAIIEEPPEIYRAQLQFEQERPLHIMKLSTKSTDSMDEMIRKYLKIFNEKVERNEDSEADFANMAYSANVGRATLNNRVVFTARNFADAARILKDQSFKQSDVQSLGGSLCFLFTGQGSQYPSMAMQLYHTSPIFRDCFDKCDSLLQRRYGMSIKTVLYSSEVSEEELSRTLFSQTSIFVVEYCLLKLWESWGVRPDYVMGHSLGEFAAAVAAGALYVEDALMLVVERSRLIDQLPRGKMLVIKADKKTVDETISSFQRVQPAFWVDYAAINSPEQTVVAGDSEMIKRFSEFCAQKNLKTVVLAATHAFHSRLMDPILEAYRKVAETVGRPQLNDGSPKFISGVEGKLLEVNSIDADYCVRHAREKVNFMDACMVLQQEGCSLFLELGPKPVLSALTMMNLEGRQITCMPSIRREENDWVTMLDSLSKLYVSNWKGEIDWKEFDKFYQRQKVNLPFYPFNRKSVWAKIETESPKFHPLIGRIIPTASSETLFQHHLLLKNASFIQDHVIGTSVIFPGAGFLEMCLAGGYATVHTFTDDTKKPRRSIALKSLKIVSPLALDECAACKVQTIVSLNDKQENDELGYSVEVHQFADINDGSGKWIHHASAKFLPMVSVLPKHLCKPVDIMRLQSQSVKTNNMKDFYEKLPKIGLRFGPQFQSLECCWKSEAGILALVKVPQDHIKYLIHPVIADAMLQTTMLWINRDKVKMKLQVPIQVEEFIWLKEAESSTQFVLCCNDENNGVCCTLMDETGSQLAYMKGVDFIETTVKLVEGMITQQSTAMPQLWEEVWKPSRGPMQGSYIHENTPLDSLDYGEEDLKLFGEKNNIGEVELTFYQNLVKLTRLSILKAFYKLGWKPERLQLFSADSVVKCLNIKKRFQEYVTFFLRSMAKPECGILKTVDEKESTFLFINDPPTLEAVDQGSKLVKTPEHLERAHCGLIAEVGIHLEKILKGDTDALNVLFPKEASKLGAEHFYEDSRLQITIQPILSKIDKHVRTADRICTHSRSVYRILEIGAGTAVFSRTFLDEVMPGLKEITDVEYYVTDVTPAFFDSAEKRLEKHLDSVIFKKYDMEKDPLEQGLCPGYFDAIMAAEVFHIAKDIKKTIKSVRSLLKPGGLLLFVETLYPDERVTFIFGLLDGYWQFQDREFRRKHTTLTPKMWEETLSESGFRGISVLPMYNNIHGVIAAHASLVENSFLVELIPRTHTWIIFGIDNEFTRELQTKLSNVNRECSVIFRNDMTFSEAFVRDQILTTVETNYSIEGVIYLWSLDSDTRDQEKVSLPFLTLIKYLSEVENPARIFAVMRGVCAMETYDTLDPTPGTLLGFSKALNNENLSASITCLDLDPTKSSIVQLDELFMNLWVEHKQSAAFRDGFRLHPRLTAAKLIKNEPLDLPNGCDRFKLILPETKMISDLEFANLEPYTIVDNEVEIEIKAMALNFRDVFTVLKPIPVFEEFNSVGMDFSGVVVKAGKDVTRVNIGDRVIGMNLTNNLSLPSHFKTEESKVIPLSKNYTFAEGATLPAVFSTAVYCLINVAKMKKGDTVLIHTASGGVGLAAIQLCKFIGASVIATAGSHRKRTYLRNLGITHVFHSRTINFKHDILAATGGHGVNIVLNSITGTGFKEASLDVLCKNGRFIEMSKLNVWNREEVALIRPDVFYELVDLISLESHEQNALWEDLGKFMEAGVIKPIPYERFDVLNIRGALNYLQKAKHIGKIVCIMPEVKLEKSMLTVKTSVFNMNSTYIVTGGLGGIGFEVIKWMLRSGAKHIAILSRNHPRPEIAAEIESWNKSGNHVQAFSVDVGNHERLKTLFEDLRKPELGFPQVRGVMHAAGVLQDAVLENQSWESFSVTYNPKVNGTWNLHDLTKNYLLEHFVLFSSISATFGNPGQSNHSASNAFEDSFASYRRSIGLPVTCVNWGVWGEVGIATEFDMPGFRPIPTAQGLLALETFLKTQTSRMSVINVDSFSLMLNLMPQVKYYLDDCRLLGDAKTPLICNADEFWIEVDSTAEREGKVNCFKKFIKAVIRNILKMDRDEPIHDKTELQALGIDSLMMLEMKNGLQNVLSGRMTFSANQLKDCNNTEVLANTLVTILMGEKNTNEEQLSHDDLKELIRNDANLLQNTELSTENLKGKPIEHVETVLLTGATGSLGPYLLADLASRKQIKNVFCLIRPTSSLSGCKRLKTRLEEAQLNEIIDMAKVKVVEGDITTEKFGLDEEVYLNLCEQVDAIVHSAVRSDHIAKYCKAPEKNKSHMRAVNVIGTVRLLCFAAEKTLKHFFHASTILTFTGSDKHWRINHPESEGQQDESAFKIFEHTTSGYVISKHVSEHLVNQTLLKGVPCKVFRFPVISGDSKTGRISNYKQNHAILRWLTCLKLGVIHDITAPFTAMPVDHCAKISLDIFFNPEAPMDVYNVVQKSMAVEQVVVEVAHTLGVQLEIVSVEEFMKKLQLEDEASPLAAFTKLYMEEEERYVSMMNNPSTLAFIRQMEKDSNFMGTSKLVMYSEQYEKLVESIKEVLIRDFTFLKNEGVFEKYGIETSS